MYLVSLHTKRMKSTVNRYIMHPKRKQTKSDEQMKQDIIRHTQLNVIIRKKLKVMIQQLPVPDLVERNILNFIGLKSYEY